MNTLLIFDFDGTLADSIEPLYRYFKKLSKHAPFETPNSFKDFQKLSSHSKAHMLNKMRLNVFESIWLLQKTRRHLTNHADEISLFSHIPHILWELHKRGYIIGILSSNSTKFIHKVLENYHLPPFAFIKSSYIPHFKSFVIKQLLRKKSYEHVYIIGDEITDIKAGQKCGINTIGVTWGLSLEVDLQKNGPDIIIEKENKILQIL